MKQVDSMYPERAEQIQIARTLAKQKAEIYWAGHLLGFYLNFFMVKEYGIKLVKKCILMNRSTGAENQKSCSD
jgi:hypothetical protein